VLGIKNAKKSKDLRSKDSNVVVVVCERATQKLPEG